MKINNKISQTFEYKILVKWVLFTELICLLIVLLLMVGDEFEGNGFLRYAGLQEEGIQTIQVLDYQIDEEVLVAGLRGRGGRRIQNDIKRTIYRLECSVILDGKKYFFTADATDVIGENSVEAALEYINYKKEVTGYLYSANNRERLCFSHSIDEASSLLYEKLKARILLNYGSQYHYRIIFYIIIGVWVLNSFKIKDNESIIEIICFKIFDFLFLGNLRKVLKDSQARRMRTVVAKDNYSDKAIKKNSEYIWYEKEVFEKEYSPELVTVAANLEPGEYRVSGKQTEAIKELCKKEKGKKLTGPILEKYVLGHDAILLRAGLKIPFTRKCPVKLLLRTMEGNYAQWKGKVDCACVRNLTGSYVIIANGKENIGIYENVLKNKENPIILNYETQLKKNPFRKIGCYVYQALLAVVSLVALLGVWQITKDWLIFPKFAFCVVTARTYKHLIDLLGRGYLARYKTGVYDGMLHEFWEVPYYLLNVLALVIIWIK